MAARGVYAALPPFQKGADAGTTLDAFTLRNISEGHKWPLTQGIKEDSKKKAFLQSWGTETIMPSFEHAITKDQNTLKVQIKEVYPVYKLFCEMPQGKRSFTEWYPAVLD